MIRASFVVILGAVLYFNVVITLSLSVPGEDVCILGVDFIFSSVLLTDVEICDAVSTGVVVVVLTDNVGGSIEH